MKLMLLDPSEVFRIGLWAVLCRHRSDVDIVDDVGRADPERIAALAPDLVLADLNIQPGSAIAMIRRLKELSPSLRVAVMSRLAPRAVVRRAIEAGACGFLLKTSPAVELAGAVDRLLNGETVVPGGSRRAEPRAAARATAGRPGKLSTLSAREREVFDLIVWGWSNKEIAAHLAISVKTVETHRGHINGKLGVHTSADIVRVAAFAGALDAAVPRVDHRPRLAGLPTAEAH
jgi:two-component system response regulator NreC